MRGKRFSKIVIPILLGLVIVSVTSCFMFFMDWTGGLEGDWIYTNTSINETVYLTITKHNLEMIFDEDSPYGGNLPGFTTMVDRYYNDWGFKGDLFVDEHDYRMDINIIALYRYYTAFHWTNTSSGTWRYGGGSFYTNSTWPWFSVPYLSNYWYNNFMYVFPGYNLGVSGSTIVCYYSLDMDRLTMNFDPGGLYVSITFKRK
jgi:hypothetical protein